MYIAMNQFKVIKGKGPEFEEVWRGRETYLGDVSGFKKFHLLRGEDGTYISHSTWESQDAFRAWTKSEAFHKVHSQGSARDLLEGHPHFTGYEVVL